MRTGQLSDEDAIMRTRAMPSSLLVLLAACTTTPMTGSRPLPTRNVITRAELARLDPLQSLHAAVAQLRPTYLRPRPGASTARGGGPVIVVHVNGHPAGGPEALHAIQLADVASVRLLHPSEFTAALGADRGADAIIDVVLRVRRRAQTPR